MLERTEQRILGVLIEKELSVPDSYPMSENALVDGCNQKSNRDPVLELVPFQVAGALMALQEKEWLARIDGGGRVPKYRHRVIDRLALDRSELAVLAELLLRGPQAPGALKPRVQRMGYHATPEQIEALLQKLAARTPPLVTQQPLAPRERDQRWRHLLGPGSDAAAPAAVPVAAAAPSSGDGTAAPAPRIAVVSEDLAERV
ncbi:MAG TPA: DUF480 domain-containing protein, partial [Planctomycetota bacterium]|nr:DUF480 domain-containing protein [Planctomycetota bacterium]